MDRLAVVCNGAVVISFPVVGSTAVVVGLRIVRLEVDCLIEVSDGALLIAFKNVGASAVIECVGIIRSAPDCLVEVFDSPVEIPFFFVGDATVVESGCKARGRVLMRVNHRRAVRNDYIRLVAPAQFPVVLYLIAASRFPQANGTGHLKPCFVWPSEQGVSETT